MDSRGPVTRVKDGRAWRIGDDTEVSWIRDGTSITTAITSAIPPAFDAYATLELPENWRDQQDRHDTAVIGLLTRHTARQPWWLGYLDTGADDVVFADAPRTTLYAGWKYVLVEAGPRQASTWRESDGGTFWKGALPNVIFPADRTWLLSTLWDDDWTCIGGRAALIDDLLHASELRRRARVVRVEDDDATPPGHEAR
jgi:hypothetical protein